MGKINKGVKVFFAVLAVLFVSSGCKKSSEIVCEGEIVINNENVKIQYLFNENEEAVSNFKVKLVFDTDEKASEICNIYKDINMMNEVENDFECEDNYIIYNNAESNSKYNLNSLEKLNSNDLKEYFNNNNYICK